jgi:hypothetical protein
MVRRVPYLRQWILGEWLKYEKWIEEGTFREKVGKREMAALIEIETWLNQQESNEAICQMFEALHK